MGIPAYFRWISEKYPHIMVDCVEHVNYAADGTELPVDATAPNPNGLEFDNLYLDMNGIIHPCTHPEDRPAPTTETEMFHAIFDYIDRIFAIVRPRKLIYMAIDGVAPRAKINQQRSRRFRAAQEAEEKRKAMEELKGEWAKMGFKLKEEEEDEEGADGDGDAEKNTTSFDSNVITPGTPFMARLAVALREYVADRISTNPAWHQLIVIFSDASVPGEGEHKIAEYIRRERAQPDYDPNLKHVMYGLDADLIMLALATHEAHFTILREEVFPKRGKRNSVAKQDNSQMPAQIDTILAAQAQARAAGMSTRAELGGKKPFHFLHVNVLREYLDYEFKTDIEGEIAAANGAIKYDLERVLDDFVFMCFFVGNDFLPHLPTLDIREGAIDYLIELYKTEVARMGYLTSSQGDVDFDRVRRLLLVVGKKEDDVFRERSTKEKQFLERAAREKQQRAEEEKRVKEERTKDEMKGVKGEDIAAPPKSPRKRSAAERDKGYREAVFNIETVELGRKDWGKIGSGEKNAAAEAALKAMLAGKAKKRKTGKEEEKGGKGGSKKKIDIPVVLKTKEELKEALEERIRQKNELEVVDNIKLGEEGWKFRYYEQKFGWTENSADKLELLRKYVEGLQWVMKYYYVGCMSWGWYYPYHYAPFASDLVECDLVGTDIQFEIGQPFAPFTQLQAVMPASSGRLVLPTCYADLMSDPKSPIIDYYPTNFALDLNGKRFAWQGVVLLPFIDEKRLNDALEPLQDKLTDEERQRNSFGESNVMVHKTHAIAKARSKRGSEDGAERKKVPTEAAGGQLFGKTSYPLVQHGGTEGIVYTMVFELPGYKAHSSQLHPRVMLPRAVLNDATRAESRRTGWKQAKFGALGRAARDVVLDRNRRLSSRPKGRTQRTGFLPDAPVINRPTIAPPPAVGSMFGGLGQEPSWMRGGHAAQGRSYYGGGQGNHVGQGRGQGQGEMYGVYSDPYREPSKFGGYYGSGQGQANVGWGQQQGYRQQQQQQQQQHWGGQGWQNRNHHQAQQWGQGQSYGGDGYAGYYENYGRGQGGGTGAEGGGGGSRNGGGGGGGTFGRGGGGGGGSGSGGGGGSGSGLAGPTAGSLRGAPTRGRGNSYDGGWRGY